MSWTKSSNRDTKKGRSMELVRENVLVALERGEKTYAHESKLLAAEIRAWRAGRDPIKEAERSSFLEGFTEAEILAALESTPKGIGSVAGNLRVGEKGFARYDLHTRYGIIRFK